MVATGKRDCLAFINFTFYGADFVAAAEADHITEAQLRKALEKVYPNHEIRIRRQDWYWRADGKEA